MEHESNGDTSCHWCTRNNSKKLGKGAIIVGNLRTIKNHSTTLLKSVRKLRRALES